MSFDTDAELDVNNIRMSQLPKYLGHTSFYGMHKLSEHMDTHTESIALAGPLKWTVVVFQRVIAHTSPANAPLGPTRITQVAK